ncbi:MAG: hypothetical protein P9M03_00895 [Candidatus Theseobacter exili]|nr:hypothetical protein [Candidatus Theseobacter exili]
MAERTQKIAVILLLICIWSIAVFIRLQITGYFSGSYGNIPFTSESALHFRYASMIANGDPVPSIDIAAQYPEGLPVFSKLTVGGGLFLAYIYRFMSPEIISFEAFFRLCVPLFFSLGIFALYIFTRKLGANRIGALLSCLLYAVSISSVLRSTGQEFSRENFALPFIFFHAAFILSSLKERTQHSLEIIISSICVGLATILWDGTQMYLISIVLGLFFLAPRNIPIKHLLSNYCLLLVLCFINPYLKDHLFAFSPAMLGLLSLIITGMLFKNISSVWKAKSFLILLFATLFTGLLLLTLYGDNYSHFGSLFMAKLQFLNKKPLDPSLLSFDARILWVPALHSPLNTFFKPFPFYRMILILMLSFWPLSLYFRNIFKKKAAPQQIFFLFLLVFWFMLYLLFVRLEVFCIFFFSALFGHFIHLSGTSRTIRSLAIVYVVLLIFAEASKTCLKVSNWGRPVPYEQLRNLSSWINQNTETDAVFLANFDLSPYILTYTERNIVLHPKFESLDMRERTQAYTRTLFSEGEYPFYRYCLNHGVNYFVFTRGTYDAKSVFSWRYIAGLKDASKNVAAKHFEADYNNLRWFHLVFGNGKYRIFRVISPGDIEKAQRLSKKGIALLKKGALTEAFEILNKAVKINPNEGTSHYGLASYYKKTGNQYLAVKESKMAVQCLKIQNMGKKGKNSK